MPGTDEDVWTQELTSFVVMGSGTNTNLKSAGYFLPKLKRERETYVLVQRSHWLVYINRKYVHLFIS